MKKNLGNADKRIRILLAAVLVVLYFTNVVTGGLGIVLLAAAAVLLLTGLVGFCPLYALLGIRSCPKDK